eukprot:Gb_36367 [translate_table: standard]
MYGTLNTTYPVMLYATSKGHMIHLIYPSIVTAQSTLVKGKSTLVKVQSKEEKRSSKALIRSKEAKRPLSVRRKAKKELSFETSMLILNSDPFKGSSYPLPLLEALVNLPEASQTLIGAAKLLVDLVWRLFLHPSYKEVAGGAP